jgi:hypothetical protein
MSNFSGFAPKLAGSLPITLLPLALPQPSKIAPPVALNRHLP